ncbi:hypothetical protein KC329_g12 [Hortaea werneckii]|nr:hypothetical protein KC329_g12 [Hortaea werneckii]
MIKDFSTSSDFVFITAQTCHKVPSEPCKFSAQYPEFPAFSFSSYLRVSRRSNGTQGRFLFSSHGTTA